LQVHPLFIRWGDPGDLLAGQFQPEMSNISLIQGLAYIYWEVSPTFFELGPLTFRWYGLLFAGGFFLGFFIMRWIYRREGKPEEDLDPLLIYMLIGTVVGARLGHVFFYHPTYYLTHPAEILQIWEGGLASHGGLIGILVALYLYSRTRPDQPYLWLLDRIAIPVALAGSFIRLGNLFNSEILGIPTDLPWGFVFARVDEVARHPVQLYESLSYLLIFVGLYWLYEKRGPDLARGVLTGWFLVTVFTARFVLEYFKMHQVAFAGDLPLRMGQLLSLPAIVIGLILVVKARQTSPRVGAG
jgi:prolipoprotein diacylglyceryl transferase